MFLIQIRALVESLLFLNVILDNENRLAKYNIVDIITSRKQISGAHQIRSNAVASCAGAATL